MIKSLRQLFIAPYNKNHFFSALYRFLLWKIIRAFRIKSFIYNLWGDRKINLHFDSIQSAWVMYNYWVDWEEFHFIKNYVKPGDVVLDIGANIGTYALWSSKFIGNTGKIHAFEPDPQTFNRLTKNIQINKLQHQIKANCLGVSETKGVLHFSKGRDIQNKIILSPLGIDSQLISCITLDEYASEENLSQIKYLKIDIEGFEYSALKGARRLLASGNIEYIQLEINDNITQENISASTLIKMLNSYNYDLCYFNTKSNKFERTNYTKNRENYFFCKKTSIILDK